ncbi:uncharacterized protein LOC131941956 [Physella acuta]|uniref:uncharacterized protein LOC131929614 n=1 Tax=Physella acuta TaxID=109671 RepID=UPI0027DC6B7A|nr:uncharacterized protein LOC131929614 [Physella acuta]XP_059157574.1 uncharacterized protein LOC131941956 [Physella acuta]
MPPPISPLKTRTSKECFSCDQKQQCNRELFKENLKLRLSYSAEKKEKFQIKKTYQVNRVKQQLERKGLRIGKFQSKVKTLQDKIASLSNSLKRAHLKCSILSKQKKKCHSQLNALQLKVTELEKKLISNDAALLHDIPHVENYDAQTIVTKVNKKQFNSSIRMVIYRCLELNVPVEAISKVIAFCTDLCNAQVDLPSVSTIAQMCREMAVLAELQVSEAIVDSDVVTIAFDATTISGKHINEVHFGTPENVFTANITELAGGRAEDYAGHVLNTIEDLATTYSSFCEVDKEETKLQMCGKVSSTLTDRASANHAAVLLLNEKLQTNLLELNCHLHPLDGIANEVRKTFQKFNSLIPSDTFGSDCRAANLLYGISKLRYKAKGDPTGFKAFLRQHSLACGIFPRYVGNRLHVMFCLAGIVYRHSCRHLDFGGNT